MAIERKNDAFSGLDSGLDAEMIKIPKAGLPQLKGFKGSLKWACRLLIFTQNLKTINNTFQRLHFSRTKHRKLNKRIRDRLKLF